MEDALKDDAAAAVSVREWLKLALKSAKDELSLAGSEGLGLH